MRIPQKMQVLLRHSTTILFTFGFLVDLIILPDIDHPFTRYVGCAYLVTIALLIAGREWLVSRNTASAFEQKIFSAMSFGISYFSGSALSFILVYALRGAAFSVSWPLLVIFALCIIANEFVETHGYRFTLDIAVLFIATLFYTIFNLPILLKQQDDTTFALSTIIVCIISLVYITLLKNISDTTEYEAPRGYALSIGIPMFVAMLYFLNVMPAIPLSLKDAGLYQSIVRTQSGLYLATQHTQLSSRFLPDWAYSLQTERYYVQNSTEGIYFFSSISAPADLTAPASHVWEYYDTQTKRWVEDLKISFDVAGGRKDGYRAFSKKQTVSEGLWRVTVKIGEKRIVGRKTFNVIFQPGQALVTELTL